MKTRVIFVGIILVLLVAGTVAIWRTSRPADILVLPSGTKVWVIGTGPGNQTFSTEKAWHRWARRVLPPKYQDWIPVAHTALPLGRSNELTILLRVVPSGAASSGLVEWHGFQAEDESGFRFPGSGLQLPSGTGPYSSVQLCLESFPRRQRDFRLNLIDDQGEILGSLRVPNSLPRKFPRWKAQDLPITRTNGPVVLTLHSLTMSQEPRRQSPVKADWTWTPSDPRWENIRSVQHRMSDATANSDERGFPIGWAGGSRLSIAEPAWKVVASLKRGDPARFGPEEKIVLAHLILPSRDTFVPLEATATNLGVDRVVGFLGGPGSLSLEEVKKSVFLVDMVAGDTFKKTWQNEQPFLRLDFVGVGTRDDVLVRMQDDLGRWIEITNQYRRVLIGGPKPIFLFEGPIPLPEGTRLESLEIIVSRPLEFEFMIDPRDIRQGSAPAR